MKAIVVAANGFEDIELSYPYYRLIEEGIEAYIATPGSKEIVGKNNSTYEPDLGINEIETEEYALMVLPGGKSPEHLRIESKDLIRYIKEFNENNKLISAICHGPQLLISADILEDRNATCYWSIKDDLENAGANFLDKRVVVDKNIITSRYPDDLPKFMEKTIDKLVD
ncbi:MAG: putative intracellular protease/amidase [Candidatus Methanohalarchaeum thermophilum]|uniref:Intracellular protease/amidase n=1 Tax=Methanohalarchaeum thermophilum TaxID=1903181 RepID=A0A1Q6DTP2_METT1|nr:MAG: putative intracellular protease/amidase [Candidatus Methanohalarchaeum thermophilum]